MKINKISFSDAILLISILLIILILLGPLYRGSHDYSDNYQRHTYARICHEIKYLSSLVESFKTKNYKYPETLKGVYSLENNPHPLTLLILDQYPADIWGVPYGYKLVNDKFEIYTYGRDKKVGGKREAQDIFLSECPN